MRKEFSVSDVADLGDGQGPEFSDPAALQNVRDYAQSLNANGCTEPFFIVVPLVLEPAMAPRLDFALGVMSEIKKAKYPGDVAIVDWPGLLAVDGLPSPNRIVVMVADQALRDKLSAVGTN